MIIITKDSQTGKLDITEDQLRELLEDAKKEGREEALKEANKGTITTPLDLSSIPKHYVDYNDVKDYTIDWDTIVNPGLSKHMKTLGLDSYD